MFVRSGRVERLKDPPLRAVQAGRKRESRQSAAKIGVGPAAAHRFRVERLKTILRGIGRIAERAGHIDILDRDPAARREKPLEAREDTIGLARHARAGSARG